MIEQTSTAIPAEQPHTDARSRRRLLPHWVTGALSWLGVVMLALLVGCLVLVALGPRLFGLSYVIVAGRSMEPTIGYGSMAIMRDIDPADVAVGDIIQYQAPTSGFVTTHRVVRIDEAAGTVHTRGDANNVDDAYAVPPENIQARYWFAIPHMGDAARWIQSPEGYIALVLIPGAAIILWELASIVRTLRRKPEDVAG